MIALTVYCLLYPMVYVEWVSMYFLKTKTTTHTDCLEPALNLVGTHAFIYLKMVCQLFFYFAQGILHKTRIVAICETNNRDMEDDKALNRAVV